MSRTLDGIRRSNSFFVESLKRNALTYPSQSKYPLRTTVANDRNQLRNLIAHSLLRSHGLLSVANVVQEMRHVKHYSGMHFAIASS